MATPEGEPRESAAELAQAMLRLGAAQGLPLIFPPLPEDDDGVLRHVRAMHSITVDGGDIAQARRLHEGDHRAGNPGHLHESRGQPGDRPLPPVRQDFPEPPRRDYYHIYGREQFRSLPVEPAEDAWPICEECGRTVDPTEAQRCEDCGVDVHPDCMDGHREECQDDA